MVEWCRVTTIFLLFAFFFLIPFLLVLCVATQARKDVRYFPTCISRGRLGPCLAQMYDVMCSSPSSTFDTEHSTNTIGPTGTGLQGLPSLTGPSRQPHRSPSRSLSRAVFLLQRTNTLYRCRHSFYPLSCSTCVISLKKRVIPIAPLPPALPDRGKRQRRKRH